MRPPTSVSQPAKATRAPSSASRSAAISLSRFNDKRAIPVLREMLDRSRLNEVRDMREDQKEDAMAVAMAPYARLAGTDARADLQRIAASDPSLRVRALAREALKTVGP